MKTFTKSGKYHEQIPFGNGMFLIIELHVSSAGLTRSSSAKLIGKIQKVRKEGSQPIFQGVLQPLETEDIRNINFLTFLVYKYLFLI